VAPVGNVQIGSRNIDIRAFTGQVVSMSHDNKFRLSNGSAQHSIEVNERVIAVARGERVTGFWGVARGKDSDWLALFNHDTGKWAWFRPARDKLAGPPLHRPLLIAAVVAGVCGVFSVLEVFGSPAAGAPLLAISGMIFWWVQRRRRALMSAVTTALTTVRMEA
jgi:hypothetical protein